MKRTTICIKTGKESLCGLLRALSVGTCSLFVWVLCCTSAVALSVSEDVAIDRELGLLNRPWKMNLIRIATRDYLRGRTQLEAGLPPRMQQADILQPSSQTLTTRTETRSTKTKTSSQVVPDSVDAPPAEPPRRPRPIFPVDPSDPEPPGVRPGLPVDPI